MYTKSMLVVLVCILALGFSGFPVVEGKSSKKAFTWNRKERLIVTFTGKNRPDDREKFTKETVSPLLKMFPGLNIWGSLSLLDFAKKKKDIRAIKRRHTIFIVLSESLYDLEDLEAEYPDLLPVSTEKLKSFLKTYSYPLLYFSRDRRRKIRGVIIVTKKVTPSFLTNVLTKKNIPLDTPFQYEKEELKKAERKKLEKEKNFAWNPKERQIFTVSGERWVIEHDEFDEFAKEMQKVLPRVNCWGTSLSLLYLVKEKKRLGTIKSCHTIFMVRPEYLYQLEELEVEYPDLLPISTEKPKAYLKSYSLPLLYFSRDNNRKIRGVIIAKKVGTELAKVLTEKPILLDTLLQYENGKLEKAEKRKEKEKEKTFTWSPKDSREEVIITVTGRRRVNGCDEFAEELEKVVWAANCWGADSLLTFTKTFTRENRDIELMKRFSTIFTVRPENLYDLEDFEAEYPDLLPVSTEKLKSYLKTYGYPLLHFSLDYTGMLRGVIIAKEVDTALAKLLTKNPIPLDTPLQYKNGKLKKLEK